MSRNTVYFSEITTKKLNGTMAPSRIAFKVLEYISYLLYFKVIGRFKANKFNAIRRTPKINTCKKKSLAVSQYIDSHSFYIT